MAGGGAGCGAGGATGSATAVVRGRRGHEEIESTSGSATGAGSSGSARAERRLLGRGSTGASAGARPRKAGAEIVDLGGALEQRDAAVLHVVPHATWLRCQNSIRISTA